MNDELREIAHNMMELAEALRQRADSAGRGPVGLVLNALATKTMLLAFAIKGAAETIKP